MKMDQAEDQTYMEVLSSIFEIPKDDQATDTFDRLVEKFGQLMKAEDNGDILVGIADGFIQSRNRPQRILSPQGLLNHLHETQIQFQLGNLCVGFIYGYLYRMKDAKNSPLKEA